MRHTQEIAGEAFRGSLVQERVSLFREEDGGGWVPEFVADETDRQGGSFLEIPGPVDALDEFEEQRLLPVDPAHQDPQEASAGTDGSQVKDGEPCRDPQEEDLHGKHAQDEDEEYAASPGGTEQEEKSGRDKAEEAEGTGRNDQGFRFHGSED